MKNPTGNNDYDGEVPLLTPPRQPIPSGGVYPDELSENYHWAVTTMDTLPELETIAGISVIHNQ